MMIYKRTYGKIFWLIMVIAFACKERYTPPVVNANNNYLVVDGVIVPGNDSTIIKLSRTINISDTLVPKPEPGAQVQVVGENNDTHPLTYQGNGRYISTGLNLNPGQKYRLEIATGDGQQYQSDFVEAKQSPAIDNVEWNQDTALNIRINVSTHDAANNSRYYKWDYDETWTYHANYQAFFGWRNDSFVQLLPDEHVYFCYKFNSSSNISIASSAKLAGDVIYRSPIAIIGRGSEKASFLYSIIVKQYVLTKEAYAFWENMKKTTEQLGSLFDAQPSQLQGNIHCVTTPSQPVIGFVSASSIQTKRIFIDSRQVQNWGYVPYYNDFECTSIVMHSDSIHFYFPPGLPTQWWAVGTPTGAPPGSAYIIMPKKCVDCRLNGGTSIKPPYWP